MKPPFVVKLIRTPGKVQQTLTPSHQRRVIVRKQAYRVAQDIYHAQGITMTDHTLGHERQLITWKLDRQGPRAGDRHVRRDVVDSRPVAIATERVDQRFCLHDWQQDRLKSTHQDSLRY